MAEATGGIAVTVAPSQSAYFAGETFSVTITFENTNVPSSSSIPYSQSESATFVPTHRRTAHSVAYPSSMPRTPKTASYSISALPDRVRAPSPPRRRNLIGKGKERESAIDGTQHSMFDALTPRARKKHLPKSLSVSAYSPSPSGPPSGSPLRHHLPRLEIAKPLPRSSIPHTPGPSGSPLTGRTKPSSPLTRSHLPTIPRSHPHARKESMHDAQSHVQDVFVPSTSSNSSNSSASSSSFHTPLTSTYTHHLDPITESSSPGPPSASNSPFPPTPPPSDRRSSSSKRRASLPPPPPSSATSSHSRHTSTSSHSAFPGASSSPPDTELLLWAYARLTGTFEFDTSPGSGVSLEDVERLRDKLREGVGVGGGRMPAGSNTLSSPGLGPAGFMSSFFGGPSNSSPMGGGGLSRAGGGGGSPSILSALFSSPAVPQPTSSYSTPRMSGEAYALPNFGGGAGGKEVEAGVMPTFETPPSMIVVDLNLAPGERRSYTYTIPLPAPLPPTYRGRAIRFSYHLVIGTSRAVSHSYANGNGLPGSPLQSPQSPVFSRWRGSSAPSTPTSEVSGSGLFGGPPGRGNPFGGGGVVGGQRSRVLRVPIRVYGNVVVGRPPRPYDLLWPVACRKEKSTRLGARVEEKRVGLVPGHLFQRRVRPDETSDKSFAEVQAYGRALLLASRGSPSSLTMDDTVARREEIEDGPSATDRSGGGRRDGCRESVEVLTRNPKKLSYDIAKDGEQVAMLTFVKSAYRLGETILGVVDLNMPALKGGRTRVLKFSASLEAHEILPQSVGASKFNVNNSKSIRPFRRVHSEHFCALSVDTLRASFSLPIPADGTPAFGMVHEEEEGGLTWKVRMSFLVGVAPASNVSRGGPGGETLLRSSVRDGPRGEWGSSWRAGDGLAPLGWYSSTEDGAKSGGGWSSFFLGGGADKSTGVEDEDGRWRAVELHTVECEVPVSVWPGATLFRPVESYFNT